MLYTRRRVARAYFQHCLQALSTSLLSLTTKRVNGNALPQTAHGTSVSLYRNVRYEWCRTEGMILGMPAWVSFLSSLLVDGLYSVGYVASLAHGRGAGARVNSRGEP